MSGTYPSDVAAAGLSLFLDWLGRTYARSTATGDATSDGELLQATATVGRKWDLGVTVANTAAAESSLAFEAARAAIEQRLDGSSRPATLWVPRGAPLPVEEPALSDLIAAVEDAADTGDGRLEVRRPVDLFLRRTSREGSVVTVLGGLSAHWAQFTNQVPGSFQLNSLRLNRLPAAEEERKDLAERIVLAAKQPDVDESITIPAVDAWTAAPVESGRSAVIGSPLGESDETSAGLRRTLRRLLTKANLALPGTTYRALVVFGVSTYAEEEKISWALRGMEPTLYAGNDIVAVVADGVVKVLLQPARGTLPWDAPLN